MQNFDLSLIHVNYSPTNIITFAHPPPQGYDFWGTDRLGTGLIKIDILKVESGLLK